MSEGERNYRGWEDIESLPGVVAHRKSLHRPEFHPAAFLLDHGLHGLLLWQFLPRHRLTVSTAPPPGRLPILVIAFPPAEAQLRARRRRYTYHSTSLYHRANSWVFSHSETGVAAMSSSRPSRTSRALGALRSHRRRPSPRTSQLEESDPPPINIDPTMSVVDADPCPWGLKVVAEGIDPVVE